MIKLLTPESWSQVTIVISLLLSMLAFGWIARGTYEAKKRERSRQLPLGMERR